MIQITKHAFSSSSFTLTSETPSVIFQSRILLPAPSPSYRQRPPELIGPAFVAWGEAPATSMIAIKLADRRISLPFFSAPPPPPRSRRRGFATSKKAGPIRRSASLIARRSRLRARDSPTKRNIRHQLERRRHVVNIVSSPPSSATPSSPPTFFTED